MQPIKAIRISLLICLFSFPAFGQFIDSPSLGSFNKSTGSGNNLSTGLIAYYRFEEASGANNAIDATGNGWTLTQNGSPGSAAGKLNNCRTYNGSTQWFSHADASQLRFSGNYTVAGWVYLTSAAADQIAVGKDGSSAGQREFFIKFAVSTDLIEADMADNTGTVVAAIASNFGALSLNTWYFVAVTHSGTTLSISVNNGTPNTTSTASLGTTGGSANFDIGARDYSGFQNWWAGRLDEFGFWNRALSSTEITELYNSGSGRDPVSNP